MIPTDNVRDDNLNMIFTTAIEGGINYWARVLEYKWSARRPNEAGHFDAMTLDTAVDFYAKILDVEEDDGTKAFHTVDIKVIKRGIRKMYQIMGTWENRTGYQARAIKEIYWALRDHKQSTKWDDVDYDADTADMIVQAGLFGEVVYG